MSRREILYKIKYAFQKIFRKNHISDYEIWNCRECLAKYILPRLNALRSQDFLCFPNDVNSISLSRTVIDKKNNRHKEELANWLKTMDEMIFAFEYALYGDSADKKSADFYTRYFGEDPYEEFNKDYNNKVDYQIIEEAHKRALKGFALFGKYFLFLYD